MSHSATYTTLRFPVPIVVRPEMLGLRTKLNLGPLAPTLCFPVEGRHAVGLEGSFRAPLLRDVAWLEKVTRHSDERWHGWGSYIQGGRTPEEWIGRIEHAVLKVPLDGPTETRVRATAIAVHSHLPAWWLLMRDWLEVLTNQDLGHEHPVSGVEGPSPIEQPAWTYRSGVEGDSDYIYFNPRISITIGARTSGPIDRPTWRHALRRTERGEPPPLVHLLLRDARAALRRGQVRRAVLDAATAVEVTVTPLLQATLGSALNESAAELLVPERTSISAKLRVLSSLGHDLPPDIQRSLFNVRNRVIHAGRTPAHSEAAQALKAATAVVDELEPLTHKLAPPDRPSRAERVTITIGDD